MSYARVCRSSASQLCSTECDCCQAAEMSNGRQSLPATPGGRLTKCLFIPRPTISTSIIVARACPGFLTGVKPKGREGVGFLGRGSNSFPHQLGDLGVPLFSALRMASSSLSLEMSDQLELLQKRVLRIIYGGSHFNSDSYASYFAEL